MASSGIKFVKLPEPLQERLTRVMKGIENGKIDPDWGGELFMKYFAYRIGIIAESSPHAKKLHQAAKGMRLALIIKGTDIDHVSTFGDKITEITGNLAIMSGSGPIAIVDGNNVEYTVGFNTSPSYHDGKKYDIIDEINLKLWKSILIRMFKHGVQYYMFATLPSSLMVEIGAYSKEYYNLLKSIKKILDPNCILSRGKFKLNTEVLLF